MKIKDTKGEFIIKPRRNSGPIPTGGAQRAPPPLIRVNVLNFIIIDNKLKVFVFTRLIFKPKNDAVQNILSLRIIS